MSHEDISAEPNSNADVPDQGEMVEHFLNL